MKNKFFLGLVGIVIIIGIVMYFTSGFKYGLDYSAHEVIEIYIGKDIDKNDAKEVIKPIFENQTVKIQTVEIFEDTLAITVSSSTDEQINKLVEAINEKYELETNKDDVNIIKVPATNINDLVDNYKIPVLAFICIGAIYISIRYWKLGILKTFLYTIITCIAVVACIVSVYLIGRIPLGAADLSIGVAVIGVTLVCVELYYNKKENDEKDDFFEEKK